MTKISGNNSSELNDAVHKRTDVDREVTARSIFGLALPALGVLAAMPLYLLLDTAVAGRLGSFRISSTWCWGDCAIDVDNTADFSVVWHYRPFVAVIRAG